MNRPLPFFVGGLFVGALSASVVVWLAMSAPETDHIAPSSIDQSNSVPDQQPRRQDTSSLNNPTTAPSSTPDRPQHESHSGAGKIIGRVVDMNDHGVPSVKLAFTPASLAASLGRGLRPWFEVESPSVRDDELRELSLIDRELRGATRVVETDQDGRFAVEGLADEAWTWRATAADHEIAPYGGGPSRAVSPGAELLLSARRMIELVVHVLMPDSSQASEAKLASSEGNVARETTWRSDAAKIRLPVGRWQITASIGDQLRSRPTTIDVDPRTAERPVILPLVARIGFKGHVKFAETTDPDTLRIAWRRLTEGESTFESIGPDTASFSVASWHDGYAFASGELGPGRYGIAAFDSSSRRIAGMIIAIENDIQTVVLEVPPASPDDYVVIRSASADGEPTRNIAAWVAAETPKGIVDLGRRNLLRRPDGGIWLRRPDPTSATAKAATRWWVTIEQPTSGRIRLESRMQPGEILSARFSESAVVDLLIERYSELSERCRPIVEIAFETPGIVESASIPGHWKLSPSEIAKDGRGAAKPLQPGRFVVTLKAAADGGTMTTLARETIDVGSGDNRVTLSPIAAFSLNLRFATVPTLRTVILVPATKSEFSRRVEIGTDAVARFQLIPIGKWTVHAGDGLMEIDVSADLDMAFVAERQNALKISIDDAGGVLAKNGFRDGDILVGVDDEIFENRDQLRKAFTRLMGSESNASCTLVVERSGNRVPLTLSRDDLRRMDADGGGGKFTPINR